MTPDRTEERRAALWALLAIPDEPELHRGHQVTVEGQPERFRLYRVLPCRFVAHAHVERLNERLQ